MKRLLLASAAAGLAAWVMAASADFKEGVDAYKKSDYPAAHREFLSLAKQGMAAAQSNLGLMFSRGHGVTRDDAEAAYWYGLAANQGLGIAQHNLGVLFKNGEGVPRDPMQALMWLYLSLDNGYVAAKDSVASLEGQLSKDEIELAKRLKALWAEKLALQDKMKATAKKE